MDSLPLNYEKSVQRDRSSNVLPQKSNKSIYLGKVIDNYDSKNLGRLIVRLDGLDNGTIDSDLIYCYPFLPKTDYLLPKKGETVRVIIADLTYPLMDGNRFWVGPVIGNFENINEEKYILGDNVTDTDISIAAKAKNNKKIEKDLFPVDDTQNGVIGRNNADLLFSDDKVVLRAGKHKKKKPSEKNNNPTYNLLQLVSDETSVNVSVGDKIYLISHNGINKFNGVLTDQDIQDLDKNTQSLLYGELTLDYMKTLTNAFLEHIHQHPQTKPITNKLVKELTKKLGKIEELLAKSVKIN